MFEGMCEKIRGPWDLDFVSRSREGDSHGTHRSKEQIGSNSMSHIHEELNILK